MKVDSVVGNPDAGNRTGSRVGKSVEVPVGVSVEDTENVKGITLRNVGVAGRVDGMLLEATEGEFSAGDNILDGDSVGLLLEMIVGEKVYTVLNPPDGYNLILGIAVESVEGLRVGGSERVVVEDKTLGVAGKFRKLLSVVVGANGICVGLLVGALDSPEAGTRYEPGCWVGRVEVVELGVAVDTTEVCTVEGSNDGIVIEAIVGCTDRD